MIAAILGTREGAGKAGLRLSSVGVTCPDDTSAAALRDALAAHQLENVMLVSAFLAAALASGNSPLFASSTAALAYAQDLPDPDLLRDDFVASSAPDDSAGRRSALLIGSAVAVIAIAAVVALEVALAVNIRPTVALLPKPSENHLVTPAEPAPAPTQVAAAPQPKIDLPRPAAPPRAASPQLPAPLPAASVPEAPVLPALPAPVWPAPEVPGRQAAPARDPAIVGAVAVADPGAPGSCEWSRDAAALVGAPGPGASAATPTAGACASRRGSGVATANRESGSARARPTTCPRSRRAARRRSRRQGSARR
ncbi:hypothetical protein A4G26_20735 [Mycobacterium kansasii]|nr:hypothetical protein A4G26_20735 [Mycobacterium kansasii]